MERYGKGNYEGKHAMNRVFLDTAIPMYAAGKESPYKKKCIDILEKVAKEELVGVTDVEVFQEILYRFFAIRKLEMGYEIFSNFKLIASEVLPVHAQDVYLAKELSEKYPRIPPRDLLHVAVMANNNIKTICSPDTDFDAMSEITRIDPLKM